MDYSVTINDMSLQADIENIMKKQLFIFYIVVNKVQGQLIV